MPAKGERVDCSRSEEKAKYGHSATDSEKASPMDGAGSVVGEAFIEETVLKFCLIFPKTALQLVNGTAKDKNDNIIRLIYEIIFDAAELH